MTRMRDDQFTKGLARLICPMCGSSCPAGSACARCYAPADVIQAIATRKKPPNFIGVLGPSGVGKTVFLGMLVDLLSRGAQGLHGIPRGTFSLTLQSNLILALERQRFPDKTPTESDHWQWLFCEVSSDHRRGATWDVVTPDVAGEVVGKELTSPRSNTTVQSLINKCAGLVALIDLPGVVSDGQAQELFAMQLVSYLTTYRAARWKKKVAVPVSFVFTKADLCDEALTDPEAFARANTPGLFRLCQASLTNFRFFASGVAGSAGELVDAQGNVSMVPLRVEPRGVVEPFSWLLSQSR
jgi:hypothetical protein